MLKQPIDAPPLTAAGPYSLAVATTGGLFVSGQIPMDPSTGQLVPGDIKAQTERVFDNLEIVLAAAGIGLDKVVKTTVFLTDMGNFAAMNEVYARRMPGPHPARSTIGVAALPLGAQVEIELIAGPPDDDWPTSL